MGGAPGRSKPRTQGAPLAASRKSRPALVCTRSPALVSGDRTRSAWPSRSSLAPAPYQGAVSISVIPASSAARTVARALGSPRSGLLPSPRLPQPGPIQIPP
eukprot:scaffold244230_cov31-Tisochrysis_lutea.AAC.4